MLAAERENVKLALRVYGLKEKDCKDSKLVLPFGETGMNAVDRSLDEVNPKGYGKTPLTYSLQEAAKDLAKMPHPRRLVVITDGLDTCGGDPCKIARELAKKLDVKIFVVGYALGPEEQRQLQCLADLTGGTNVNADDTQSLFAAMLPKPPEDQINLLVKGPDPTAKARVFVNIDGKNEFVESFITSIGTKVPAGTYNVEVQYKKHFWFHNVIIREKEKKVLWVTGDGFVHVKFLDKLMRVQVLNPLGAVVREGQSDEDIKVPTGYYKIKATAKPFVTADIDDVMVIPRDVTEERVENFGVLKATVPGRVSAVPVGYYIWDEKNQRDLGSYLSGLRVVLPAGMYSLMTIDKIRIENVDVPDRKQVDVMLQPTPVRTGAKGLMQK